MSSTTEPGLAATGMHSAADVAERSTAQACAWSCARVGLGLLGGDEDELAVGEGEEADVEAGLVPVGEGGGATTGPGG